MKTIIVAPHPDDEVLGAGGTLLRRKVEGAEVAWLIVTSITAQAGYSADKIRKRANEIQQITKLFDFDSVSELNFPTAQLDQVPMSELVAAISNVFKAFQPDEVFVPHPSDVHTDHRIVFDAVASCTKWFRHPSIKRVLAYETISETDFGLGISQVFQPNVMIDIEPYLADKLRAMEIYASELSEFPFPRSHKAMQALATLRGAASGFVAAEAFELLRERL
jgi:LmbE family N-acetylglucosaminyl deacetylase